MPAAIPVWIVPDEQLAANGGTWPVSGQAAIPITGSPGGSAPSLFIPEENVFYIPEDYPTIERAMYSIGDYHSTKRYTLVVTEDIEEPVTVQANPWIDVIIADGVTIRFTDPTSTARGVVFNFNWENGSAKWWSPGRARLERVGQAGERNIVVEVLGSSLGLVELENLDLVNLTTHTGRNYGLSAQHTSGHLIVRNCRIYGAGTTFGYGSFLAGTARITVYDSESTGAAGGETAQVCNGWTLSGSSIIRMYRCHGFGGTGGASSTETYGFWVVSTAGAGAGQNFVYLEDCVGWGGSASEYNDGFQCHKSNTAHFVRCVGISGPRGNGWTLVGHGDNSANFLLDNCVGICRATDPVNLVPNRHGIGLYEGVRSRINGGSFYGSPFIPGSAGLLINQHNTTSIGGTDLSIAEMHGARFYGGGAGLSGQTQPTQSAGCPGAYIYAINQIGLRLMECSFIGNQASPGISIRTGVNTAILEIVGGVAYSENRASYPAITSEDVWASAAIYGMVLPGGLSANITPAAGTPAGTNITF